MMRWIVASSLKFRLLVLAAAAALVYFGTTRLSHVSVDVFPEFAPPRVGIQTEGQGMSSAEVVHSGKTVHLSTTDPAAHVSVTLAGSLPGLQVDRIDPKAETEHYIEKVMSSKGHDLDDAGKALLREDLRSPCTEEVAVFHAFSRIVGKARSEFVVLDTAPTGHTMLLLDATGAYHRQVVRDLESLGHGRIVTPLMRLQDSSYTRILLVTLPETTPVSEAAALQEDLRRPSIRPYAWVINGSLLAGGTREPLLAARLAGERIQIRRVCDGLAERV